jgi:outer membrane protein assembly factor BamC
MKFARLTVLVLQVALLVACKSGDFRYQDSTLGPPLELPPDLAGSEIESKFELPATLSGDKANAERDKVPVLARVYSMLLESNGDMYWIRVEEPVDNLYQLVKNFWAAEGYRLDVDEPVIGLMQTEWIYKEEGGKEESSSWIEGLFTTEDLSASQDQYRSRIERDNTGNLNRIYIAHRGTEYKHVLTTEAPRKDALSENEWVFRPREPELEIEMLSRLMIYLGLQDHEVEQQRANIKLFKPRAIMEFDSDEGSPFLIINDIYQIAWNRVFHQLERMNFEIVSFEFKSGLSGEGVIYIKAPTLEVTEEGGFFSFQSEAKEGEIKLTLVFSEESNQTTRLILEDDKGEFDTSAEGNEFFKLLFQQIK